MAHFVFAENALRIWCSSAELMGYSPTKQMRSAAVVSMENPRTPNTKCVRSSLFSAYAKLALEGVLADAHK
jgi:hypothetical protein